jgi:hypothetical protein
MPAAQKATDKKTTPATRTKLWSLATVKSIMTTRFLKVEYKCIVYCILAMGISYAISTTETRCKFVLVFITMTLIPLLGLSELLAHYVMHPPYCERGLLLKGRSVPAYWGEAVRDPTRDFGIQYEDVSFEGASGLLSAWLCTPPEKPSGVVVICCHGAGRDRRGWLRHLPFLVAAGHHVRYSQEVV